MSSFFLKTRLEKDFEWFVTHIARLQPIEFCGLAKILSVPVLEYKKINGLTKEQIEKMGLEEKKEYIAELMRPTDLVLEEMMDRFLSLSRKRRKEINQIIKDCIRESK